MTIMQLIYIYFLFKKLVFIQQIFAKLLETVIVNIDIVRKHLIWINAVLFIFLFISDPHKSIGFQK